MTAQTHKRALVTGGARRIGRAIALDLAEGGMDVVIHFKDAKSEAEALVREIEEKGRAAAAVCGDLSDPASASVLFEEAARRAGPIDVLVNNASIFDKSVLLEFSFEELAREISVNAFAPLELARAFSSQCAKGAIVNLLDSRMNSYDRHHAAYHLSKRMLYSITRMLALELAPAIRVNGVAPGLILPPPGEPQSYLTTHKKEYPLKRHGSPEGVAEAVRYLVGAEFVTGQVIFVDGGRHMTSSVYG
jgi:NAD(P)-dependent dehydrogenase (short-subunit alcohol dehydrogenase family)